MREDVLNEKIILNDHVELQYWIKKFGCTEAQLKAAVLVAGISANSVKEYIDKRKASTFSHLFIS